MWAQAHELAEQTFGQAAAFFGRYGNALVAALEDTPSDVTVEQLLAVVAEFIEKARPKPKANG